MQDLFNQLRVLISDRGRKQKLRQAFEKALETNQEFQEFQTDCMLIAPKELPKAMQNKYANKAPS